VKKVRTPLWMLIRLMGYRQKNPRPRYAKTIEEIEAENKKNS